MKKSSRIHRSIAATSVIVKTFKTYYRLAKPGIVYGNALTAIAGYFYGAHGHPSLIAFLALVIGISLVMASACVYNNVLDRDIDQVMSRTRNRALVTKSVGTRAAVFYASILLVLGVIALLMTNILTLAIALFGHIAYAVIYTYAKRKTVHGTLIGTISGSTPPVIGYVAATNQLDITAGLLFIILVTWQMTHFFAIAIFRKDDYAKARIPVLSVVRGVQATKHQMIIYTVGFVLSIILMGLYGGTSLLWTLVMLLAGLFWLYRCFEPDHGRVEAWARKQFGTSLVVLLLLSASLSLDGFLH
jgi:heme o synthase